MTSASTARTHEIIIQTPEGVAFSLPLAGPIRRFLALIIDLACISAIGKGITILAGLMGLISEDFSQAMAVLLFFIVSIGYGILLEWFFGGQTFGKRVFGLRVADIGGLQLKPNQIIIRNLLRAVDTLPAFYLMGGFFCLGSRYAQRLGDLAANTIVIKSSKIASPQIDRIFHQNHYNSLRRYPHLIARLRQSVTAKEAEIALQTLLRRDILFSEARVDLFDTMAEHFQKKVKFPPEALDGISQEQYVRNVVDILFRA